MIAPELRESGETRLPRILLILAASAIAAALLAALLVTGSGGGAYRRTARPPRLVGVNLASGGFAGERIPGIYGQDYIYPDRATAAPFLAAGMTTVRMPILWERVQDKPFAPLIASEMARIDASLGQLAGFALVILDVHNYAAYRNIRLDQPGVSGAMLADLWSRLATRYRDRPEIAFGMMNEPSGIDARAWRAIADQTLVAIRATGARNLVLVPGTRWTGAHSWLQGGAASNAAAFADFRDPASNFAFEFHDYLDVHSSGIGPDCVNERIGAERLAGATTWLRTHHYRGFLGEFGGSAKRMCLRALDGMLDAIDTNSDVWLGWTYWAAGAWWGDYPFSVQPDGPTPRPQMAVLTHHIGRGAGS